MIVPLRGTSFILRCGFLNVICIAVGIVKPTMSARRVL